jgi:hypothetical protein
MHVGVTIDRNRSDPREDEGPERGPSVVRHGEECAARDHDFGVDWDGCRRPNRADTQKPPSRNLAPWNKARLSGALVTASFAVKPAGSVPRWSI